MFYLDFTNDLYHVHVSSHVRDDRDDVVVRMNKQVVVNNKSEVKSK